MYLQPVRHWCDSALSDELKTTKLVRKITLINQIKLVLRDSEKLLFDDFKSSRAEPRSGDGQRRNEYVVGYVIALDAGRVCAAT